MLNKKIDLLHTHNFDSKNFKNSFYNKSISITVCNRKKIDIKMGNMVFSLDLCYKIYKRQA